MKKKIIITLLIVLPIILALNSKNIYNILPNETKFVNQPEQRLTNEFKSYSEFFKAKLSQQDTIIKDLKPHQKHIQDNTENYAE